MPKIEVPQPRALPITDTSRQIPTGLFDEQFAAGQSVARSIGQAGQVMGAAAINTIRAQGEEEFTAAKLDYETAFRSFQSELLTDTDYADYTKKFNDWHDDFTAQRLKQINHRGAQTRAQQQFDFNKAIRGKTIDTDAQNTLVRQTRKTLPDKIDAFVSEELQADTPETMTKAVLERKEYFKTLIETGVLNAGEAATLEKQYQEAKGQRVLQNTVTAIAAEGGWDEALKFLNDPKQVKELIDDFGLELADIDKVLEDVRTQARLSRADGIAELNNQRAGDRLEIVKSMRTADFKESADLIANSSLSGEEQFAWEERLSKRAEAVNNGKDDPMNQTDPAKYFELRRKIETEPGSVIEDDLAAAVGEGISIPDYEKLLGIITDKDNPLNDSSATRAQSSIGRLRTQEIATLPTTRTKEDLPVIREIEAKYLKIANEYDDYLLSDEGRKATDKQKEEKLQTLTGPVREKITLNWFSRLMRKEKGGQFFGLISSEEKALVSKKIKALKKEGLWETLNSEEKAAARKRFEQGQTVDEIMRLLQ